MIWLDNSNTDPWLNLALEEYLLKEKEEEYFMVWQNDPCVVIGRHQDMQSEVDIYYAKREKLALCRRYSGGGAVYQDKGNINLTFINNGTFTDSRKYTAEIVAFLHSVTLTAQADERQSIRINGLKISGCAQCLYRNRWLHHATLLFDSDLNKLRHTLNPTNGYIKKNKHVASVKSPVTNIKSYLSPALSIREFTELLKSFFISRHTIGKQEYIHPSSIHACMELKAKKYATQPWINEGIIR